MSQPDRIDVLLAEAFERVDTLSQVIARGCRCPREAARVAQRVRDILLEVDILERSDDAAAPGRLQ